MRILGLDIGSQRVKAVEIDSAFGRFEVHEYHELAVPAGVSPVLVARDLVSRLPKAPDRLVIALRSGLTTLRNFQFPSKDRKAIQASVGFELDDDLPFELEDAAYGHSILFQTATGSQVHVSATLGTHLQAALDEWRAQGLDPDVVTTEAWALRALMNRVLASQVETAPVLLVDIGHTRTLLYFHHKGVPILAREIPIGGRDFTLAIQEKYKVGQEQAEAAKLEHGFVLPPSQRGQATAEQSEFSNAVETPLSDLVREIRHANLVGKNLSHELPAHLFLCGGGAQLPGLGRYLEEEVKVPVQSLKSLSSVTSSGVAYSEQADSSFGLAAGLALSLVGQEKSLLLNLRTGEFSKNGGSRINWSRLKGPMIAAGLIATSLLVSVVVQNTVYRGRMKSLDSQLERQVKSFFGSVSSSALRTYLSNPTTLKKEIQRELSRRREAAALMEPNKHSPLRFVREISSGISKDIVVDLIQLQVGAATTSTYAARENPAISMTFWVTNPQIIERLSGMLEKRMTGFSRSKVEETVLPDQSKRWKVVFGGRPMEEGYGN